jgi:hypothetical protein
MSDGSPQCVYITVLNLLFILATEAVQFWNQVTVLNHWYLWDWVSDQLQLFRVRASLHSTNGGHVKVKVKESRNRPGVAQRVPGGLGSQIS